MARIFVKGYTKKDGTKVAGYYKELNKTGKQTILNLATSFSNVGINKKNFHLVNKDKFNKWLVQNMDKMSDNTAKEAKEYIRTNTRTKRITSVLLNKKKKKHQGFYDFKKYIQKGGRIWD